MPADYQVPATGTIDYQYFEVPTNFTEDQWMQAGEVRAGDRAHVHHIIVYVREPAAEHAPERGERSDRFSPAVRRAAPRVRRARPATAAPRGGTCALGRPGAAAMPCS